KYGAGGTGVIRKEWDENLATDGVISDGVRGILFGDASQLMAQLLDAAVVAVFGFVMAYVWLKLSNLITRIRVPAEVEMAGLDIPEMGALGYPNFELKSESH